MKQAKLIALYIHPFNADLPFSQFYTKYFTNKSSKINEMNDIPTPRPRMKNAINEREISIHTTISIEQLRITG